MKADTGLLSPDQRTREVGSQSTYQRNSGADSMNVMPRKKKKQLEPPSPDVAAKQTPGFTGADFDKALDRATRQVEPNASGRDPRSPKTSE